MKRTIAASAATLALLAGFAGPAAAIGNGPAPTFRNPGVTKCGTFFLLTAPWAVLFTECRDYRRW